MVWSSSSPFSGLFRPYNQFFSRVLSRGSLAKFLDGFLRLAVEVRRDLDLDGGKQAAEGPVLAPDAPSGYAEGATVGCSRRDADGHRRTAMRRHLDLRAEGQLGERHRNGHGEVVTGPAEH